MGPGVNVCVSCPGGTRSFRVRGQLELALFGAVPGPKPTIATTIKRLNNIACPSRYSRF